MLFALGMFVAYKIVKIMYNQQKAEREFWNGVNKAMKQKEEEMRYAGFHA